jgi:uracil-DNA glycosylase
MGRSDLEELLLTAERGDHGACRYCPSSPRNTPQSAWGVSCREHGIDWSLPDSRALSMMVVQDPANTTPAITGKLCVVCNSKNASDGSAQHGLALWAAAVALTPEHERPLRYVDGHYWANAAMHSDGETLKKTSKCCRSVLLEQIKLLKPHVMIATGEVAAASLKGIGLLKREWREFNSHFEIGAYSETAAMRDGHKAQVFCTYHESRKVVNQTVARYRYSDTTERLLAEKRESLADPAPVDAFLSRYPATGTEGKGMRVLLLHWLDIGEAIRKAHEEAR